MTAQFKGWESYHSLEILAKDSLTMDLSMNSRERKIKYYLESTNKSVIKSKSPWNDCMIGYFFCRYFNGSVRVHGPSILTEADSICLETGC